MLIIMLSVFDEDRKSTVSAGTILRMWKLVDDIPSLASSEFCYQQAI